MENFNPDNKYPKRGIDLNDIIQSEIIIKRTLNVSVKEKYYTKFIMYLIENKFTIESINILKDGLQGRTEKESKLLGIQPNASPSQFLFECIDVYDFKDYPVFEPMDNSQILKKIMELYQNIDNQIYLMKRQKGNRLGF